MGYIIVGIIFVVLYLLYLCVVVPLAVCLTPLGAAVFAGWATWNYLQTMWKVLVGGEGPEDEPKGKEPAYKQYFFHKAYLDYKEVLRQCWAVNRKHAERVIEFGAGCFREGKAAFTWPLGVAYFIALPLGVAGAGAIYLIFVTAHAVILALCASVMMILAGLLCLAEYAKMAWNRISLRCPHGECYKKIAIPIYQCPNCGSEHKQLIPGPYGLFGRRCQCETAYLRTMFLLGRNKLPSYCPHCRRPLNELIGIVRNLHIPIVGGAAAGKTSFLMANMSDLYRRKGKGEIGLEFPEKKDEVLFEHCFRDFARGVGVGKTTALSPDAFQVKISDPAGNHGLLYVYDAAGELYQEMDTLRRHEYYDYSHGILFLLDPFSLPEVKTDFEFELSASANEVKPSAEEPQEVYARMIATFRQRPRMKNGFGKTPLAIVVTKADAFGLDREIQATVPPATVAPASHLAAMREAVSRKPESPESAGVRQWLIEHGGGNLVRAVEQDFQNVRYFHCSALGRLPDSRSSPFTPKKALEPLVWLMDHYHLRLGKTGSPRTAGAAPGKAPAGFYTSSARKIHNQVIVLSLWIVCMLGSLIWVAQSFYASSTGTPNWFSSSRSSANTPPRPLTPAEALRAQKEVTGVIINWIGTLRNRSFDQHVSYYADEYFRWQNRAAFRRQIESKFLPYSQIYLNYESLAVSPDRYGLSAKAVFVRKWRFEGNGKCEHGTVKESVDLRNFNGVWLIVGKSPPGKMPLDSNYRCPDR